LFWGYKTVTSTNATLHDTPATSKNLDDLDGEKKARWIATSVEIFDHPILKSDVFDRVSAFQWLVANAAWKAHRTRNKGKVVMIERGQCMASLQFLADKWGWGVKKVRNFLDDLASENMIEKGKSEGHYANVITICNYDKYQTARQERDTVPGQEQDKSRARAGQDSTRDTNTTNKKITTPAREKPVSGRAFWANAISAPPSPEIHPHVGVTIDDSGAISLHNEFERFWLNRFGGNADRLGLALIQIAAYVQANSGRPLEAQVGSQLARIVGEKLDRDDRAAKSKFSGGRPATADFRSQLEAI